MKTNFKTANAATILDDVIDSYCHRKPLKAKYLKTVTDRLYLDKRGGDLAHLYENDEFMSCLDWNIMYQHNKRKAH